MPNGDHFVLCLERKLTCGQATAVPVSEEKSHFSSVHLVSGPPPCVAWHFVQIEQLKGSNAALVEEVQRLKEELSKSKVSQ